jgi:integrase
MEERQSRGPAPVYFSAQQSKDTARGFPRKPLGKSSAVSAAFRHWHAQSLIRAGAQLEDVQSVLGHATPVITKQIYAPEPNLDRIADAEKLIQKKRTKGEFTDVEQTE